MDKTDGSITSSYGDWTREDFLFTYNEDEKQQNEINRNNSQLILNPKFIPISPMMIRCGYSYLEAILYWFIDFFLCYNDKFYCTNEQLWEMLWVSDKTISLAIKRLIDDWLIAVSYKIKSWGGKIRFLKNVNSDFTKMYSQTLQKGKGIDNKIIDNKIIDICLSEQEFSDNIEKTQDNTKERKENVAAKEKKERSPKKSKKRMDYPEDYEKIWRIYPHNHCVKQDVYWLWQQYSEEEKARLLIWAQIEELKWDYVKKWETRMSNRMDRWMDSYTLTKDWIPEFVDIVDKLNNIQDEQTRKEWLDKAREYFGEDYVRTALSKVTKKITLEFH